MGFPYFTLVSAPSIGTRIFTDPACTIPFTANPYPKYVWMSNTSEDRQRAFLIDSSGFIVEDLANNRPAIVDCNFVWPPSGTPPGCP
jgi:hypothetical protein